MYKIIWVGDLITTGHPNPSEQEIPQATAVANRMARDGWELHSVVPGTNAQTYGGLFLTFVRAR